MADVLRCDVAPLAHVERMDSGGLRIKGQPLARTGIQVYRDPATGQERREYRPPEEVSRLDSLMRLRGAPVTNRHSTVRVTTQNWREHAVGHVGDNVTMREDGVVVGDVVIHDETAIQDALAARRRAVSVGYKVRLDETPGTTPTGQAYDVVQRDIRPNHVALVARGRAGDVVQLRLDADDSEDFDTDPPDDKLDESQASKDEAIVDPKDKRIAELEQQIQTLTGQKDAAVARADAAEQTLTKTKAQLPEMVRARVALQDEARRRGVEVRADQSDGEIRRAVIAKVFPTLQVRADAGDDYLEGVYSSAVATPAPDAGKTDPRAALGGSNPEEKTNTRMDEDDPPWVVAARERNASLRGEKPQEKSK